MAIIVGVFTAGFAVGGAVVPAFVDAHRFGGIFPSTNVRVDVTNPTQSPAWVAVVNTGTRETACWRLLAGETRRLRVAGSELEHDTAKQGVVLVTFDASGLTVLPVQRVQPEAAAPAFIHLVPAATGLSPLGAER